MAQHDTFISYATEDNDLASEIAYGLRANGLSVWFAPLSLKVGDKLLDSIEAGLDQSRTGTLILSRQYLNKAWTSYEMDILVRQHIEGRKTLLPIWHNSAKSDVEAKHRGLGGIVAITDTSSVSSVVSKLVEAMSNGAPSRAVIPIWEHPTHRFLQGLGEVNLQTEKGPATTIFEFLIHAKEADYPLWVGGKAFTKKELLYHVAQLLGPDPDRVKTWVRDAGYRALWDMCVQNNLDPKEFY